MRSGYSDSLLSLHPHLFSCRYGTRQAVIELKDHWLRIIVVGFLIIITYGAVLFAYSMGHISYVGSIREVSIVFGALMGWRFWEKGLD